MELSIKSLQDLGAFTGALVRKEITWEHNGETFSGVVHIRPPSYQSAVTGLLAAHHKGDQVAARIASCICDKDGKPLFTPADVDGSADPERGALSEGLTVALLNAIAEMTAPGKKKPMPKKSSARKKTSGTSSSSTASAAAPLPKPSTESATPST